MISKPGTPFAPLFEALKRKALSVSTQVREGMKDPFAAWQKLRALMANGQTTEKSNMFNGLGISIAIITFGMLGLPIILMYFVW